MNNKRLGMTFEKKFCEILARQGYWVHFIAPDMRGSQPFDIVAMKNKKAYAYDCKTSANHLFPFTRLEDNQIMAFDKWLRCGGTMPYIAIAYNKKVYLIEYEDLKRAGTVDLTKLWGVYDLQN